MSLDGFIAGPGGDLSWLAPFAVAQDDPVSARIMQRTGALLVGRRTFGGDDALKGAENQGEAFGGGWSGPQFVLTHRVPKEPVPGVTFVTDLREGVAAAKAGADEGNGEGDRCVGVLGAFVAAQCIEQQLLDEVAVFVAPVMLGGGVRMFDRPHGPYVRLEPLDPLEPGQTTRGGLVATRYRVVY
jgi:dihydrofolate reductase